MCGRAARCPRRPWSGWWRRWKGRAGPPPGGVRPVRSPSRPPSCASAPNRQEVLRTVRTRTGVGLYTLPGEVEAELTFLGARRWMGWRSGPLALFDIGGGSLEVAFGRGRLPDYVASLPLGAGRLTHEFFEGQDPPPPEAVRALRRKVRHQLRDVASRIRWEGPRTAVATSRTFEQLGRLCGAPPGRRGPFVERRMHRADLREAIERSGRPPAAGGPNCPASPRRAPRRAWPARWSGTRR